MRFARLCLLVVSLGGPLAGCGSRDAEGPPTVRLGESICTHCNMIISDERFATATVVQGPRGPEARLFDDFNCQVNYESTNDEEILARWSHDYGDAHWLRTESAWFLNSPNVRAPMASETAAFATRDDAEAAQSTLGGDILSFEATWARLARGREDDHSR